MSLSPTLIHTKKASSSPGIPELVSNSSASVAKGFKCPALSVVVKQIDVKPGDLHIMLLMQAKCHPCTSHLIQGAMKQCTRLFSS